MRGNSRYSYFLLLAILFCLVLRCQQSDMELIAAHVNHEHKYEYKRKVEYLFKNRNIFVKYNPVSLIFGGALYLYQSGLSKQISAQCPYEVNCSNFSRVCIRKYGLVKGILLTSDRLTRCTRLAAIDINEYTDFTRDSHRIIDNPEDYSFKDHAP
jgi:putative component of membrane protein insertase Oxa1/YidC/SpoIIIJ protein YidD